MNVDPQFFVCTKCETEKFESPVLYVARGIGPNLGQEKISKFCLECHKIFSPKRLPLGADKFQSDLKSYISKVDRKETEEGDLHIKISTLVTDGPLPPGSLLCLSLGCGHGYVVEVEHATLEEICAARTEAVLSNSNYPCLFCRKGKV